MGRRVGLGILLILIGAGLFILQASGYTWDWYQLWPSLIILLGLLDLIENGWRGLRGGGGFLILVGGFLLLFTMRLVPWHLRQAWPAGLVLLGLLSLLGDRPSLPWAIILIGGGSFLLAVTTGKIAGGWGQLWPFILILAGLVALVGQDDRAARESRVPPAKDDDHGVLAESEQERLRILARIRRGELSVEEGAAILEGLKREKQ